MIGTLRNKIVLLACAVALGVSVSIGTLVYFRITALTLDTAVEGLAGETRLVALKFKASYDQMRNDAFVASKTAPVQGIIRSLTHNGVDPTDGSTTEMWRKRLELIFSSLMEARPYYTQFRFIGVSENGKEIVRVNHTVNGLEKVKPGDLQEKGQEPYFKRGLELKKGEFYFSEVTYNREHGGIDDTFTPTVRLVIPVFVDKGNMFGFIVINADYRILLAQTFQDIASNENIFITNHAGDYMEYHPDGTTGSLELHLDYTITPPDFITKIKDANVDEEAFFEDGAVAYFVRLMIDPKNPEAFLGTVLRVAKDDLLKGAYKIRRDILLLSIALIIASVVITGLVASYLTKPLHSMTAAIRQRKTNTALVLPITQQDEIGELARAFTDMTDKMLKSKTKLRVILNNTIDGILTVNKQGNIESFNPACERIFGYSEQELLGTNIAILVPNRISPHHQHYVDTYVEKGEARIMGEGRGVHGVAKDGRTIPLEIGLNKAVSADGDMQVIAIIRDITDRKRGEAEKEKLIRQLARSNEELDNFAHITSHDLKEPLRAIHNHSRFLMKDHQGTLGEEGIKRLNRLVFLTKRMENLINDLLYFSRLGREELAVKPTDLNHVIDDIKATLNDTLEAENVMVDIVKPLPVITCDQVRVTELFRNLITNAIKYNNNSEKKIEIGTAESNDFDKPASIFYVKDNGIGIEKELHGDVFQIFRRLHKHDQYGGGMGVGLTFVQKIIQRHGGKIWLESEPGNGTTFYFTLSGA